ncbi:MAG: hypothetical protein U9R66_03780 [Thermodesulfobacteriota bacterium]|nr:hypothetical protein [Thermodesulfobacteriota bacterium]
MILKYLGLLLIFIGLVVSVSFWIPQLVNKPKLKVILGKRYPIIYFVYITNGPLLVIMGLLIFLYL